MGRRVSLKEYARQEILYIVKWAKEPSTSPQDYMKKLAVRCFLEGRDPAPVLAKMGIPEFQYMVAIKKAIIVLNNERAKRRPLADQIRREREEAGIFTSGNLRVKMNHSQNRIVGSMSVSIYCVVQIYLEDEEVEKEYLVCYSDFKVKEWLTKTLVWALTNQREVTIKPASDIDMNSMRMFVPKVEVA